MGIMDANEMITVKHIDDNIAEYNREKMEKSKIPSSKKSGKLNRLYNPVIIPAWCKSCGICSAFCPKNVIGCNDMGAPVIERPNECIGCRFCELHCPDFAITIKERNIKTQVHKS
jgi:2-oxoglutarate ferredoxin oxidoreductase subunit delta